MNNRSWRKRLFATCMAAILMVVVGLPGTFPLVHSLSSVAYAATTGSLIARVYTDKARYQPGNTVTITAALTNNTGSSWTGTLALAINKLESQVYTATSSSVTVAAGASTNVTFTWTTPATDFTGYYASVTAGSTDANGTGIDVSSNPNRFPRYGYISDFPTSQSATDSQNMINQMAQDYHLNMFQFYDWMWRHDALIQRTNGVMNSTWTDLFGRTLSTQTMQNDIAAVHGQNANAMAYAMTYAARENYQQQSGVDPSWGIYSDTAHASQLNFPFGNGKYIWLFNPANQNWQNFITGQYKDAINTLGFDGIQLDQMGQRDNVYDYNGFGLDLQPTFPQFTQSVRSSLNANNPAKANFTFNIVDGTVNGWAANHVSQFGAQDFNFSEIWYKSNGYNDLRNYVEQLRRNSGKAVVLAGYMNYNQEIGPLYEAETATLVGVTTNTNHLGYTGTGFVDGFTTAGSSISWNITFPETGDYSLDFRYSNATGSTATRNVYIDGTLIGQVSFNNQANWDTWSVDACIQTKGLSAGTHTIKLAFDPSNTGAINVDHLTLGQFDDNSIRLADAMMFASGATHLELGDHNNMLPHEYYPNQSKSMRNSLKAAMKDYYSFATAYENLLFDADVVPADQGSQWLTTTTGQTVSGNATANTIWQQVKRKGNYDVIHLINLIGNTDNTWRSAKNAPTTQSNVGVKYYPGPNATINGVYLASPDSNHGQTQSLSYTTGSDSNGTYVLFTVPSLQYWDMIYVNRSVTAPSGGTYEAESAIRTGVTTNTNHLGYTGTGFVDGFTAQNSGVSFTVNVPTNDSYTLRFRYANATGAAATRTIYVDGQSVGQVTMPSLYNWDMWDTVDKVVRLTPGVHEVAMWYTSSDAQAINLDNMQVLEQTNSASRSNTSLWMNNWSNMVGIAMASKLAPNDTGNYGPRLAELHYSADWGTNQLNDATAFFRDETGGTVTKYDSAHNFDSSQWFESDSATAGVLTQKYGAYSNAGVPIQVTKQYAMVPNQNILAIKYTFTNLTNSARTFNFLEQAHLASKNTANSQHGWWDVSRNSLGTDMSQTGQYYIELGAFQTMGSHQVGNDSDHITTDAASSPWYEFDANGTLNNNGDLWVSGGNLDLGFQQSLSIPANGTATLGVYYTIGSTQAAAEAAADTARAQTVDYWFGQTATAYTNWLNSGTRVNLADTGINTAYDRSLIINKQAQQPQFGSWPAATNPAYAYKVWVRDSAATAMGLDATGHTTEAEKYWNWMASVQNTDGTWHTNYSVWAANQWISFVEPENDAIGLFIMGVYRHYNNLKATNQTAATNFLNGVWPAVTKAGDWIKNNIGTSGLGPADASIWEESPIEQNSFTQTTYAEGLNAGSYLATAEGDTTRQSNYASGATTIKNAMLRSFTASPRGLWNDSGLYFNRGVNTDGTADTKVDDASNLVWVFGLIPSTDTKLRDQRIKMLSTLQNDGYGLPRYANDPFYYSSQYSPGGMNEAGAASPVWPQMSMYAAMYEHWTGNDASSLARLQWYVSRTARGMVTTGEAVDWTNGQPLISTSAEPVTGAWFQMAVLNYLNKFDPRLPSF